MDVIILDASLISFFVLVISWLAIPDRRSAVASETTATATS